MRKRSKKATRVPAFVAMMALAIAVSGCGGETPQYASTAGSTESQRADDRTADALCAAVADETAYGTFSKAFSGDIFVTKNAVRFDDHAAVAKRALDAGATAVEPWVLFTGWLDAPAGAVRVAVHGMVDWRRLAPYVAAGSLDSLGPSDIALPERLAKDLGVGVGATVDLHRSDAIVFRGGFKRGTMRVAAIVTFPGDALHHDGESTVLASLEGARALQASNDSASDTNALKIWTAPADGEFVERFRASLPDASAIRIMTSAELGGGIDRRIALARPHCKGTQRPQPSVARQAKPRRRMCDLHGQVDAARAAILESAGSFLVDGPPDLDLVARATQAGVSAEPRVWATAGLITARQLRMVFLIGLEEGQGRGLEQRVARGNWEDVVRGRGIAISQPLADRLNVEPGDELVASVAALEGSADPTLVPLRVASIVTFPAEEVTQADEQHAWVAADLLRNVRSGVRTGVALWLPDGREGSEALKRVLQGDARLGYDPSFDEAELIQSREFLAGVCGR